RQFSDRLPKTAHRLCARCWPKVFGEQFRPLITATNPGLRSQAKDHLACPGQRKLQLPQEYLLLTQTGHCPCSQTRTASILRFGQHCPQKQTRIDGHPTHDWPRSAQVAKQFSIVVHDRRLYRRSSLRRDSTPLNHHWCPAIYFHLEPPPQSLVRG